MIGNGLVATPGQRSLTEMLQARFGIPQMDTVSQPMTAPIEDLSSEEPFVWGAGGSRLSPDAIARQREMAMQQMQAGADYSPVGHWSQGLARVAQSLLGSWQNKKLDKAEAGDAAEAQERIASLLAPQGGGDRSGQLLGVLADPNASPQEQMVAKMLYERNNPKPQAPTEFERILQASGIIRGSPEWTEAMKTKVANTLDPFTNLVVGGNSVMGRQSAVQQAMQGGAQAPTGPIPQAPVGRLRPITGGPTQSASGGFRR